MMGPVFEVAREAWIRYGTALAATIPDDDVRHNLWAEARTRLEQLDIILENLADSMKATQPDADELRRTREFHDENYPAFRRGEISVDDWIDGSSLSPPSDPKSYIRTWTSITLFTESFYFFAWRLMEVLNRKQKEYAFPGLRTVEAPGITLVRNHLLEHPEKPKHGQNFTQGLVVTSAGPVLRTTGAVLREGTVHPLDESVDRGLYVTADAFRDELETKFELAARELSS